MATSSTTWSKLEFRAPVAGGQQVRGDVFATAQQVAGGFLLLRRNVDGGQRTGPEQHTRSAVTGQADTMRRPTTAVRLRCMRKL